MAYDGKDELKEEFDRISKMSPYERLRYLKELASFYKQQITHDECYSQEDMKAFIDRVALVTKGY